MTPFDLVLGGHGQAWLLGAIALAALLTLVAAALEIALERAGGRDPASPPDWFAERAPALFVLAGVPAIVLAVGATVALTLALGGNPERSGMPMIVPLLLNGGVLVAVFCCGVGSPLTQHWGLGVAVFGIGVSAIFPLLFLANALPFAEDGSLGYPERLVFALTVGLILLTQMLTAAALLSLLVTSLRTYRSLRSRQSPSGAARLTLVRRGD